jgi:hypothetical protein
VPSSKEEKLSAFQELKIFALSARVSKEKIIMESKTTPWSAASAMTSTKFPHLQAILKMELRVFSAGILMPHCMGRIPHGSQLCDASSYLAERISQLNGQMGLV